MVETSHRFIKRVILTLFRVFLCMGLSVNSSASTPFKKGTLIRDAEVEYIIKAYTRPLFEVAGLEPDHLSLYLVVDSDINAAASVNYSLFLNTGFLLNAKNPEQIMGVLAHETGHIADGHVVRMEEAMRKSSMIALAGALLGGAAAALGGGAAGSAILVGSMSTAQGHFMHYSQGQEAAADHAAVRYLSKLGWSSQGLLDFMKLLGGQELLSSEYQDAYLRTHPLTAERIAYLKNHVTQEGPQFSKILPDRYQSSFLTLQAKLLAYIEPGKAILKYSPLKSNLDGLYALSIAHYRKGDFQTSLKYLNVLLEKKPKNPFYWELKGQIFFENGHIKESLPCYKQAVMLENDSALLKMSYAQSLLSTQDKAHLKTAFDLLLKAQEKEEKYSFLWHLFSVAYGRMGDLGMSALSTAYKATYEDHYDIALKQAKRALTLLKEKSGRLKAQDLIDFLERQKKETASVWEQ